MKDFRDLEREIQQLLGPPDSEQILREASTYDMAAKLAEMRLCVMSSDGLGVVGLTKLGRDVLIGLLWLSDISLEYSAGQGLAALKIAAAFASRCVAFDELPDAYKSEIDAYAVAHHT